MIILRDKYSWLPCAVATLLGAVGWMAGSRATDSYLRLPPEGIDLTLVNSLGLPVDGLPLAISPVPPPSSVEPIFTKIKDGNAEFYFNRFRISLINIRFFQITGGTTRFFLGKPYFIGNLQPIPTLDIPSTITNNFDSAKTSDVPASMLFKTKITITGVKYSGSGDYQYGFVIPMSDFRALSGLSPSNYRARLSIAKNDMLGIAESLLSPSESNNAWQTAVDGPLANLHHKFWGYNRLTQIVPLFFSLLLGTTGWAGGVALQKERAVREQ